MLSFTLGNSASAFASTTVNVGVTTEHPASFEHSIKCEVNPFGLGKPGEKKVENLNDGQMNFAGVASSSVLYTNNNFTGKSTVNYQIKNNSNKKLTIKLYEYGALFLSTKKLTIDPNSTSTGTLYNLCSSKSYYLSFSAPSDFSGYVK